MLKTLELVGAYGRNYTSLKGFKEDWNDGKDFKIKNGPYLSNRDLEQLRDYGTVYYKLFYKNGNAKIIYIIRFGEVQSWVKT